MAGGDRISQCTESPDTPMIIMTERERRFSCSDRVSMTNKMMPRRRCSVPASHTII